MLVANKEKDKSRLCAFSRQFKQEGKQRVGKVEEQPTMLMLIVKSMFNSAFTFLLITFNDTSHHHQQWLIIELCNDYLLHGVDSSWSTPGGWSFSGDLPSRLLAHVL